MKTEIQPKYAKCEIKCACGNVIEAGSVKESMKIDTCSSCHPFFTGQKQAMAAQGRAAKFTAKFMDKK